MIKGSMEKDNFTLNAMAKTHFARSAARHGCENFLAIFQRNMREIYMLDKKEILPNNPCLFITCSFLNLEKS
jgi:hypothetical protein